MYSFRHSSFMQIIYYITLQKRQKWNDHKSNQVLANKQFKFIVINWMIDYSSKLFGCQFWLLRFYTNWVSTNFKCFQCIKQNASTHNTNLCSVNRNNYLPCYTTHTFCQLRTNTPHSSLLFKSKNDLKQCCLLITNIIGCWQKL